jgi:drug/metabolite transporter (DMT)-like permease
MDLRALLMGLIFALMWSSAFATARIIVADAAPLAALALRFLISGGLAIALALALGARLDLTRAQWRSIAIFGLLQNAAYLGFNFIALQWVEASLAVIIAASMPLMVAALSWAFRGESLPPLGLAGLVAGFAGTALIMGTRLSGGADPLGTLLCIAGALALAIATLTLRSTSGTQGGFGPLLLVVGLQMLAGSAALAVIAALTEPFRLTPTLSLALAFAYQIFIPGLAATLLWFALVRRIGPTRAATFHFLNPAFGTAIAALLLNESLGALDLIGAGIVAAGILAVQVSRKVS